MAHFAELDENNVVLQVIVVSNTVITDENGIEHESLGIAFCQSHYGGRWLQTSYNNKFRGRFAGIGSKYDADKDIFIPIQLHPSCVFDDSTCSWICPPNDGGNYVWNAQTKTFELAVVP